MFMISVITNSVAPTAKIVLYSIDAGRHVAARRSRAMNAVIVSIGLARVEA